MTPKTPFRVATPPTTIRKNMKPRGGGGIHCARCNTTNDIHPFTQPDGRLYCRTCVAETYHNPPMHPTKNLKYATYQVVGEPMKDDTVDFVDAEFMV